MNIQDISRITGFSTATISRVINNSGYVKAETRQKILKAIAEHNYTPNAAARSLSRRNTFSIGVIIPDIDNSFFAGVIRGISSVADKHGYNIILFDTDENPEREHNALIAVKEARVNGLIITPVSEADTTTRKLLCQLDNSGIPVVLVDRDMKNVKFDGVFINNIQGAYDSTVRLIKLGHRRIAAIAGPDTLSAGKDRLKGYFMALEDNGIEVREDYVLKGNFKLDKAYELTKQLFELEDRPTAIFTLNNMTTLGCLKCLTEKKIKAGRDIGLIGFDDIEILNYVNFNLSAVKRPVSGMGIEAANLLFEKLNNKETGKERKRIVLPVELVLRGSEKVIK